MYGSGKGTLDLVVLLFCCFPLDYLSGQLVPVCVLRSHWHSLDRPASVYLLGCMEERNEEALQSSELTPSPVAVSESIWVKRVEEEDKEAVSIFVDSQAVLLTVGLL